MMGSLKYQLFYGYACFLGETGLFPGAFPGPYNVKIASATVQHLRISLTDVENMHESWGGRKEEEKT